MDSEMPALGAWKTSRSMTSEPSSGVKTTLSVPALGNLKSVARY